MENSHSTDLTDTPNDHTIYSNDHFHMNTSTSGEQANLASTLNSHGLSHPPLGNLEETLSKLFKSNFQEQEMELNDKFGAIHN